MKRVELLEALFLQGKKMRDLQVFYFSLRKGGGRFSSAEAKKVLEQSKLAELEFDKMVKQLHEWWDCPPAPSGGVSVETCSGRCFLKENRVRCSACRELSVYPDVKRVLLVSEEKGTRLAAR